MDGQHAPAGRDIFDINTRVRRPERSVQFSLHGSRQYSYKTATALETFVVPFSIRVAVRIDFCAATTGKKENKKKKTHKQNARRRVLDNRDDAGRRVAPTDSGEQRRLMFRAYGDLTILFV